VLLTEDAYVFAVALLALWHSGRHAILPPNHQRRSLQMLHERTSGVLSDRPDWFPGATPLHPLRDAERGSPATLDRLRPRALAAEFYTSGSTGSEKPVAKRICHLEDEVRELDAIWHDIPRSATVFATASHQHLYGLLFGVLWPLCAARPFQAHHFLHVGELVPRMRSVGRCVLASVPTYLRRLARYADTPTLRGLCHPVFSSGGPLAAETAHEMAGVLGEPPLEVLGSTETGGIAWRVQEPGSSRSLWTPFPSVRVARDPEGGVLQVTSPFVSVGHGSEGFATGDRVSLHPGGRFELEGRSGDVVKVGEKRLDLTQMAAQLREHAWVEDVGLATVDRAGERRVAAAIVPTSEGWDLIAREGRRAFSMGLRRSLADAWDPVLHPRYWRAVEALPENSQGKVTLDALDGLFRGSGIEISACDRPVVLDELRGAGFVERHCRVPNTLSCFAGHFPGDPVLPGVLQLDWAMELGSELLETSLRVAKVQSLKILDPLRPGDCFRIRVHADRDAKLRFRIWSERGEHSKGCVALKDDPGSAS
jgi:3-hydroxymyristoyl/3-hydroxydecanoyl-(acyl carrier protein) dehydratase/acyl-CoA synthetase (AMP-forming)/AMP-acid ligase II